MPIKNKKEGETLKNYFHNPLIKFFVKNYQRTSGFNTAVRRSKIPVMPEETDLFKYFNLTQEEIKFVNEN